MTRIRKQSLTATMRETTLVILFADVSGSTRFYELLGDQKARELMSRCISLMSEVGTRHKGTLIKTMGDEVMTTFPTANDAAAAASDMQTLIGHVSTDVPNITLRIGFHAGSALRDSADVFGDAVNVAARITDRAKGGQILTTSATVKTLSPDWHGFTRRVDQTVMKGKKEQTVIFELLWQRDGVTRMVSADSPTLDPAATQRKLVLRCRGRKVEVSKSHPMIVMGRAEQNDLIVQHDLTSRLHARIEYRKDKFILTDLSTNGTYVVTGDAELQFVRQDSLILGNDGIIGLGVELDKNSPEAIHFSQNR